MAADRHTAGRRAGAARGQATREGTLVPARLAPAHGLGETAVTPEPTDDQRPTPDDFEDWLGGIDNRIARLRSPSDPETMKKST